MYFFSVIAKGQTWRNIAYLLLAFPLGIFYFTFLVTGLSLGLGLLITLLGIPILLLVLTAAYGLGAFERSLTNALLGLDTPPSHRLATPEGLWGRIKALVTSSETWKRIGYLFAEFPLGIIGFSLVVTTAAVFAAAVVTPLFYEQSWWFTTEPWLVDRWAIDTIWEALIVAVIGVLVGFGLTHVINGVANLWRFFAHAMLGPSSRP